MSDTLAFDLVAPFITLNFGVVDPARWPRLQIKEPDRTDAKLIADAAAALIPLGLRVDAQRLRELTGLPDPPPGTEAETLGGGSAVGGGRAESGAGDAEPEDPAMNRARDLALNRRRREAGAPAPSSLRPPHASPTAEPQAVLDAIAAPALADWKAQLGPVVNPILAAAGAIAAQGLDPETAYQAFLTRVETLAGTLDAVDLIDTLARATFQARGYGDAADV